DRSPDSRTIGVNEVRCSAAACSLVTVTSRLHRISRVTGSIAGALARRPRPRTLDAAPLPLEAFLRLFDVALTKPPPPGCPRGRPGRWRPDRSPSWTRAPPPRQGR